MIKNVYGEEYILIDSGDTFAGNWDQLADCFGIDIDTIEEWCRFNNSTFSLKKYDAGDEMYNNLWKLYKYLNEPAEDGGAGPEFTAGNDNGTKFAAEKIKELMKVYDDYVYRPAPEDK